MSGKDVSSFGRVAVLMGGDSAEREISLLSGTAVLNSLLRSGVDAQGIDAGADLLEQLEKNAIDRVCIMLHGRNGEDGKVQKMMELAGLPYTGSGVAASELAMDKIRCKQFWRTQGFSTPDYIVLNQETDFEAVIEELEIAFVKPVNEGSSIGVAKVNTTDELIQAYENASQYDAAVIAEKWIDGPEYTVGILGNKTLPVIELRTKNEFYDYDAKYKAEDTQYLCPCNLSDEKKIEIQNISRMAYDSVGCKGWGRVDLMQDKAEKFWLLEVNTIPGMTGHSLVPMAALEVGVNFDELVLEILASSDMTRAMN